jgi:hypothetical protein
MNDTDPDTFIQKNLMQRLLHAAQHLVTREEMVAQFSQYEGRNQERFKLIDKHFDDLQQETKENKVEDMIVYHGQFLLESQRYFSRNI